MSEQKIFNLPEENIKALDALFSNIQLIEQNKSIIYQTDDYYNIYISGIGVCIPYIETIPLFLGDLLQLWEHSIWQQEDNYIYFVMGSLRSSNNICHIWNIKDGFIHKSIKDIKELAVPAFSLLTDGSISTELSLHKSTAPAKSRSNISIFSLINRLKN